MERRVEGEGHGSGGRYAGGVIDTHCHLTFPEFAGKVGPTLDEAAAAGVAGCITISTTTGDALNALRVAKSDARVWCSAGVHPLYSDRGPHDWGALRLVAQDDRCVAWGELGLDRHYAEPSFELQRAVLDEQLAFIAACERGEGTGGGGGSGGGAGQAIRKPIVLHCREAFAELIPVLRGSGLLAERMVFHCFTAGPTEMRMVLDFGAMVSFTGVVTYGNAAEVKAAARLAPVDRVMVETDAPFLSPEPVRKKRPCVPAMVRHTLEGLAAARGEGVEALHEAVNVNTSRFFGIPLEKTRVERAGGGGSGGGGSGGGGELATGVRS